MDNNLSELIKAKALEMIGRPGNAERESLSEVRGVAYDLLTQMATFALSDPSILNAAGLVRNQWVDCKEILPEIPEGQPYVEVLLTDGYFVHEAYLTPSILIDESDRQNWNCYGEFHFINPTHWMYVPQPPISINNKKEV